MINVRNRRLNIEGTPRCTLECSMCKRTTYFKLHYTKVVPGNDLTPDELKRILKYWKGQITFSGQLSDPIFNKHFIELLKICKERNTVTRVNTAATGRKEGWYENAFLANPKAIWTFGIDGPPHLSHKYRVNQNGEFLFKMMLMARLMGIKTYWQYIIFKYNEKYIDECKKLAIKYGIKMDFIKTRRRMESLNE
tara:strand:+ start:59 stop:640 length:582 start_codon:yes stop_codon:yes gene_type:complete